MTYVEQDDKDAHRFRVSVDIAEDLENSFDTLALDTMRLPRKTRFEDMTSHQRTMYRKVFDGVQSMHLFQVMWDVDAINWLTERDAAFDFNVSGWLRFADECISIKIADPNVAMLFKLTWCGT